MTYEIYAVIILVIGIIIAIWRSINKSKESKYRVWGITTILIFAPVFSWLVGSLYGMSEGSGFAMMGVLIVMFPILFIVGVVLYWIGSKE
ncbi:hypothetical protein ACIQ4Z_15395 [Peribacillus asahii]|uniref:hypothetical protein n=1 Tax=Peribacillus asahii TaxID=228899 RepID=UPI0037F2FFC5